MKMYRENDSKAQKREKKHNKFNAEKKQFKRWN